MKAQTCFAKATRAVVSYPFARVTEGILTSGLNVLAAPRGVKHFGLRREGRLAVIFALVFNGVLFVGLRARGRGT
jgi:hypothetical protein